MPLITPGLPGPGPLVNEAPVGPAAAPAVVDLPPKPTVVDTAVDQAANN